MVLIEERWRSPVSHSRTPVRGGDDALVRRHLELDELDQPPVRTVPLAVRVHTRVIQAIEQRTNPRARGGRVLHLLTEDVAPSEPPDGRLLGAKQPFRCKRV